MRLSNQQEETGSRERAKLFGFVLCGFLLALGFPVNAQQVAQLHHIGFLDEGFISRRAHLWGALQQRLRELGYIEGQSIAFDRRGGDGNAQRLAEVSAQLVRSQVNIIVTGGIRAAVAAHKATATIPIVMASGTDPVGVGLITSLSRPGGNDTGVTTVSAELGGKRLELLQEIVPQLSRVAVLRDPPVGTVELALQETQAAAPKLGLQLQILEVHGPKDFENAFLAMVKERSGALLVISTPMLFSGRMQIAELATKHRVPAVYHWKEYVEAGGLLSYGTDLAEGFRRAAIYVDKILRGSNPATLPVEQPTKFELVINLKAAKQIGLAIPPNVLARADKVIR
ncbi:MAG TPA: ABC transporter substrate-binding protein [Candidatus Binatia bacterium]